MKHCVIRNTIEIKMCIVIEPTPIGGRGNDVPLKMLLTLREYMGLRPLTRKIICHICKEKKYAFTDFQKF
jgi:hypothetical protein